MGYSKKLYNVLGGLQVLLYLFYLESVHKQFFILEYLLCISSNSIVHNYQEHSIFVDIVYLTTIRKAI